MNKHKWGTAVQDAKKGKKTSTPNKLILRRREKQESYIKRLNELMRLIKLEDKHAVSDKLFIYSTCGPKDAGLGSRPQC